MIFFFFFFFPLLFSIVLLGGIFYSLFILFILLFSSSDPFRLSCYLYFYCQLADNIYFLLDTPPSVNLTLVRGI